MRIVLGHDTRKKIRNRLDETVQPRTRRAPNWCRSMTLRSRAALGCPHRRRPLGTVAVRPLRDLALGCAECLCAPPATTVLGYSRALGFPAITEDLNGGHRIGLWRGRQPNTGARPNALRHRPIEPASEPDGGGGGNGDRLAARRRARHPAFSGPAGAARDHQRADGSAAGGRRLARLSVAVASRSAWHAGAPVHADGDGRRPDDPRDTHRRRVIAAGPRRCLARI